MAETRLTPLMVHVLLTLADEPAHGYGILQAIEARTDGHLRPGPSSLYYALGRLEDGGLVAATDEPDHGEPHEEQRRYYRITDAGRERLATELDRLSALVAEGRRLGLSRQESR